MTTPAFPLVGAVCLLRPWALADLPALVRHANDKLLRQSFLKDGVMHDQRCYGWVAE